MRGYTPWGTSNGEYGRFHRRALEQQLLEQQQLQQMKHVPGDNNNSCEKAQKVLGSSGTGNGKPKSGDAADANNNDPGVKLPPIERKYMIASRPCRSFPLEDKQQAVDARRHLRTSPAKRFMSTECSRLWTTLQQENGPGSGLGSRHGSRGGSRGQSGDTQVLRLSTTVEEGVDADEGIVEDVDDGAMSLCSSTGEDQQRTIMAL